MPKSFSSSSSKRKGRAPLPDFFYDGIDPVLRDRHIPFWAANRRRPNSKKGASAVERRKDSRKWLSKQLPIVHNQSCVDIENALIRKCGSKDVLNRVVALVVSRVITRWCASYNVTDINGPNQNCRTAIGSMLEREFIDALGYDHIPGQQVGYDVVIEGNTISIKLTVHDQWMIRKNSIGHHALLFQVDLDNLRASVGVVFLAGRAYLSGTGRRKRATSEAPKEKDGNTDEKLPLDALGRSQTKWFVEEVAWEFIPPVKEHNDYIGRAQEEVRLLASTNT